MPTYDLYHFLLISPRICVTCNRGREREQPRFKKVTFPAYSLLFCVVHKGFVFYALNFVSRKLLNVSS